MHGKMAKAGYIIYQVSTSGYCNSKITASETESTDQTRPRGGFDEFSCIECIGEYSMY